MNTPSHFLINYSLGRLLRLPQRYKIKMSAVAWGSLAPDIMLYLLSVVAIPYYAIIHGWSLDRAADYVFDVLFFENIGWIIAHNFMQAPIILTVAILISFLYMRSAQRTHNTRRHTIALWCFVLFLSAMLHTILDILTHHDDGPLLLFPFNLTVRFFSPVSYWDEAHYGNIFFFFEAGIDLLCAGYLIYLRIMRVRSKNSVLPKSSTS